MTAEVAIMNKSAVALAADSVDTIDGGRKVFTTVDKLFPLSPHHPIGFMVYGNGELMGVPWETIIKMYCRHLGTERFATVDAYAEHFLRYLGDGNPLFPEAEQTRYVGWAVTEFFQLMKDEISQEMTSARSSYTTFAQGEVEAIVGSVFQRHGAAWEADEPLPGLPEDYGDSTIAKYSEVTEKARDQVFEELPLTQAARERLSRICADLVSRSGFPSTAPGVVIAGFGEDEYFPALTAFRVEAVINGKLKYGRRVSQRITFEDRAWIQPFAQREMVDAFMDGVDPGYHEAVADALSPLLDRYRDALVGGLQLADAVKTELEQRIGEIGRQIPTEFATTMEAYRREHYVAPIMSAVSVLPRAELAAMAEMLVNLACFKQKVSLEQETVGGSVDVALISKGDGFVWVRRKSDGRAQLPR
jgi:hypothetical protein